MLAAAQRLRTPALALSALLLGYSAHSLLHPQGNVVEAQSRNAQPHDDASGNLGFQLSGIGPNSALTIYSPADHTLYVYPAVTEGNTHVSCSFLLHIGRPGAAIDRQNCSPGTAY